VVVVVTVACVVACTVFEVTVEDADEHPAATTANTAVTTRPEENSIIFLVLIFISFTPQ
jgi:hypothetical protein